MYSLIIMLLIAFTSCEKLPQTEPTQDRAYNIAYLEDSGLRLNTADVTENARTIELVGNDTLLLIHSRNTATVVTYHLQIAGDISSAEYVSSFSTTDYLGTTQHESNGHGIYVKRDSADRVWLFNRREVWQFDLREPGNMLTANYSAYKDLAEHVERGHDIDFNASGNRFYVEDRNQALVMQFNLTEAWNISTLTFDCALDIAETHEAVRGIEFRPDGRKMYLLDTELQELQQFHLPDAWDICTAVFETRFALDTDNPRGFTWNRDGSKAYVMDATSNVITQYHVKMD